MVRDHDARRLQRGAGGAGAGGAAYGPDHRPGRCAARDDAGHGRGASGPCRADAGDGALAVLHGLGLAGPDDGRNALRRGLLHRDACAGGTGACRHHGDHAGRRLRLDTGLSADGDRLGCRGLAGRDMGAGGTCPCHRPAAPPSRRHAAGGRGAGPRPRQRCATPGHGRDGTARVLAARAGLRADRAGGGDPVDQSPAADGGAWCAGGPRHPDRFGHRARAGRGPRGADPRRGPRRGPGRDAGRPSSSSPARRSSSVRRLRSPPWR
jgi:hypothetical protein